VVPKFTSLSDLIGFMRALPSNANYTKMLADDFGLVAPDVAPSFQKEYLWKYLVQGQYHGKAGDELMAYAVDGVNKVQKTYYVDLKEVSVVPGVVKTRGRKRKIQIQADNAVIFDDRYNVWRGWYAGKIQVSCKTKERAIAKLAKKLLKINGM
jgi:hypothetical protein